MTKERGDHHHSGHFVSLLDVVRVKCASQKGHFVGQIRPRKSKRKDLLLSEVEIEEARMDSNGIEKEGNWAEK